MHQLTFESERPEVLRNSDLSGFSRLIRDSLYASDASERPYVMAHFPDIRFDQEQVGGKDGDALRLFITLTPGSKEARVLLDRIKETMEERFLFLHDTYALLR